MPFLAVGNAAASPDWVARVVSIVSLAVSASGLVVTILRGRRARALIGIDRRQSLIRVSLTANGTYAAEVVAWGFLATAGRVRFRASPADLEHKTVMRTTGVGGPFLPAQLEAGAGMQFSASISTCAQAIGDEARFVYGWVELATRRRPLLTRKPLMITTIRDVTNGVGSTSAASAPDAQGRQHDPTTIQGGAGIVPELS